MKKFGLLFSIFVFASQFTWGQTVIFSENIGTPSSTTSIITYTGWQNTTPIVFSGSADVRNTLVSTGYTGASGGGNVFITNVVGRDFLISGINTSGYSNITLSLGHFKSTVASSNELLIEVSPDGTSWTPLSYSRPTGSGTAIWLLLQPTGTIPSTSNLRIRFTQTSETPQFRVDDIILQGTLNPHSSVTAIGTGSGTGTISWTLATGYSNPTNTTLVFIKASSPITVGTPTNNVSSYTANTVFGSGTAYQNDANAYCVFNGDGSSVNISGIADGTTYHVLVFNVADPNIYSSGATGSGVLPVELSSFSASVVGNAVKLNWKTETEVNNYGFDVERKAYTSTPLSVTGWEKIGFVNGNGNSNSPKSYSFVDDKVSSGKYSYRLKQIDNDGQFEYSKAIEVDLGAPKKFELSQNYPNPFNPITTISFNLPEAGNVKLTVFNILGQELKTLVNEFKESGIHTINFDASELNSGMYIYKLEAGSFVQTRKMTLVK